MTRCIAFFANEIKIPLRDGEQLLQESDGIIVVFIMLKSIIMDPDKKKPSKEPEKEQPQRPITEVPPEHKPVKEPEVGPEVKPDLPNRELPGKEDIPPIKAFISRLEMGYL